MTLRQWLGTAREGADLEPTAMTLATVDGEGRPDARVVLCKGVDDRGVRWFTNLGSVKSRQLRSSGVAALVFHWPHLERQARLRGVVEVLPDAEADAYFASRPRGSQLGAWASDQSQPIDSRAALERRAEEVAARFSGRDVPRPPQWGGWLLRPHEVELWQGRPSRLHDRLRFTRRSDAGWSVTRLQP